MAQHPGLGSLMTKVLARPFAGTPRIHKPHITEGKNKERNREKFKQTYKQKITDRKSPKTNGESHINQKGIHKETHKLTCTKRKKKKKEKMRRIKKLE